MPDHLGDALSNSEPLRHHLVCVKCGSEIMGSTAVGVRYAMQRHRKHCPARTNKEEVRKEMTTQETGLRLQLMSDEVAEAIKGAKNEVTSALENIMELLSQCKFAAENPTTEVASMLGEDHLGTIAIVGNTAGVTEELQGIGRMIQETKAELNRIDPVIDSLRFVYTNVGADILRAGGGS